MNNIPEITHLDSDREETLDVIFIVNQILENAREHDVTVHYNFV